MTEKKVKTWRSFRLPKQLDDEVVAYSERYGVSYTQVVVDALQRLMTSEAVLSFPGSNWGAVDSTILHKTL